MFINTFVAVFHEELDDISAGQECVRVKVLILGPSQDVLHVSVQAAGVGQGEMDRVIPGLLREKRIFNICIWAGDDEMCT